MAGTIFGIPLSQRVDLNGLPSVGWLLYLYQANTSTPVNSYQDTALSVLNPWPIQADSYGMMRQFWLADGSYRARATNADGSITYFDQLSILALGASAGAAPSGGVDPTTVFQTGDVMWLDRQGTRTGWVRDNGRTIGPGASGATERPNDDTHALYDFLWNNFDQTMCPVTGGRGPSPLSDWTAAKPIATPDKRGRGIIGLDDMGAADAGRLGSAPITTGSRTTAGSQVGDNRIILTTGQMPPHTHAITINDPSHTHGLVAQQATFSGPGGQTTVIAGSFSTGGSQGATQAAFTGITASEASVGNADIINNIPVGHLGTFYRKL